MPPRTLQDRAKAARLRAGFRLPQEAADAIGCSRPLVVAWESGAAKSIGAKYLLDAAKAYKVRPEWLNLESNDDGYPWSAERADDLQPSRVGPGSQIQRLDVDTVREVADAVRAGLREGSGNPKLPLDLTTPEHAAAFVAGYLLAVEASQQRAQSPAELVLAIRNRVHAQGARQDERGDQKGNRRPHRRAGTRKAR